MPRQSNGSYVAPGGTAAVTGTTISSTAFNTLETDIGQEITNSLDRLGRGAMEAALNMGGYTVQNVGAPVFGTDAVNSTTSLANAAAAAAALNLGQGGVGALSTLASASTADLGAISTHNVQITGTTTITSFGSSASTTFPLYQVEFAGALTLTYNATSLILPGAANITTAAGDSLTALYLGAGNWRIVDYCPASGLPVLALVAAPSGRLTLTSATPFLSAAVLAAATIYFTPTANGNQVPVYNGSSWSPMAFAEISQALSDTTHSPAGAVANSVYDLFVGMFGGSLVLARGPAWSSTTARSLPIARGANGLWTNNSAIVNGSSTTIFAVGYGLYVGTIATDASGGTVTFNPTPAAASGGPVGGASVGLWNMHNRVTVTAVAQDSKPSWNYGTNTWRSSDNSNNNRVTFIVGQVEESISSKFQVGIGGAVNASFAMGGIGFNSITTPSGVAGQATTHASSVDFDPSILALFDGYPVLGQNYTQALETAASGVQVTWNGVNNSVQVHGIATTIRY